MDVVSVGGRVGAEGLGPVNPKVLPHPDAALQPCASDAGHTYESGAGQSAAEKVCA